MGEPQPCWLVLVQPKGVVVLEHSHAHKELQARELLEELQALVKPLGVVDDASMSIVAKEGGLMAALHVTDVCTSAVGDRICVFQGELRNLDKLSRKYGPAAAARPLSPTDSSRASSVNGDAASPEAAAAAAAPGGETSSTTNTTTMLADGHVLNAAEMVLHMYEALGVALLAQLVGRFSLCMYDAKQMRVLAARDGSGAYPLLQARTSRDSLVIATHPQLLACCHDTLEFSPGFFKYGWHAEPRLFTPQDAIAHARRSIDQGYSGTSRRTSMDANHRRTSTDAHSRRTSVDANGHGPHHGNGHGSHHGSGSWRATSMDAHMRGSLDSHGNGHAARGAHAAAEGRRSLDGGRSAPGRGHHHHAAAAPQLPTLVEKHEEQGGKGAGKHGRDRHHAHAGSHAAAANGAQQQQQNGHHPKGGSSGSKWATKLQQQPQQQQPGAASVNGVGAAAHALSHLNINAAVFVPSTSAAVAQS